MRKRLNDTAALASRGIAGGDTTNPDVSGFRAARGTRPGQYDVTADERGDYYVRTVPEPAVGSECLRGATAYLAGRPRR